MKEQIYADFCKQTADHGMKVIKSDGIHRHLRFRKPGTGIFGFEIITWPGHLCYTGDMGTFVFQRLEDMLEFFRHKDRRINLQYWAEKVIAGETKVYSKETFHARVKEAFDSMAQEISDDDDDDKKRLWKALEEDVLSHDEFELEAHTTARDFEFEGFELRGFWEHDLKDYTYRFVWACHAIAWAVEQWDHHIAAQEIMVFKSATLQAKGEVK
jgi:hypothetical protein